MSQSQMNRMPEHAGQNADDIQEKAMNVVYNFSSIITFPVEILLRLEYGTMYFSAPIAFISAMLLTLLATFSAVATSVAGMIPFAHIPGPVGLFGLGAFTKLFYIASAVHSVRLWRRILHPEREKCSTFEGPPLPFFQLLPKPESFWLCRIVWEPLFVASLALVLGHLGIIQSLLEAYFIASALFLSMKNYVAWFKSWAYIRRILDARYTAPIIAKIVDQSVSPYELAQIHLAALPKDVSPEVRLDTIRHIARAYNCPEVNDK